MNRVVSRHAAIGCIPGCIHRGQDIETLRIEKSRKTGEQYEVLTISPQCDRAADVGERRSEIYARAHTAAESAMDGYKSLRGKPKARRRAWDIIAAEWKEQPCPFAEEPE